MIHILKTWPEYFQRVVSGQKNFEIRYNDRDYQVGDILELQEYSIQTSAYSGNNFRVKVTYVFHGGDFGLEKGYVVMGIVQYC